MKGKGHWERKKKKKKGALPSEILTVYIRVSTRKISFDMKKSHNRKCCSNTGLVSSDKYLI